jgi:hypothetical protein
MLEELIKNHEFEKFKQQIMLSSSDDVLAAIHHYFVMPGAIRSYDKSARKKRDEFFRELLSLLAEKEIYDAAILISDKLEIVYIIENVFDRIVGRLNVLAKKQPIASQVWSHVARAEASYRTVRDDIEKYKKELASSGQFLVVGSVRIKNDSGHEYNPDAVLEDIGITLSLTLSMLSHRLASSSIVDGKTIFPPRPQGTLPEEEAEETQYLAITWKRAEDASYRAIAFGGRATSGEFTDDDGKTVKYSRIERTFSKFEAVDLFAHERLNSKLSQNYSELLERMHGTNWPLLSEVGPVENGGMLSLEEIAANYAVEDILCFSIQNDNDTYAGLTLREWIRGYSILRFVVEFFIPSGQTAVYSRKEILEFLIEGGLRNEAAIRFLHHSTFGEGSRDLFDTPLLCISDDTYYVFSPGILSAQIPNVIFSRLSSLEAKIDKKGRALERRVHEVLERAKIQYKHFKFKEGDDEYEFDCVFIMDNKVFVVECKSRTLSGLVGVASLRKSKQLKESAKQVLRLVDGLKSFPHHFAKQFNAELSNFEIIPVVLNSMPISCLGLYEGVYLTDNSALSRFFRGSTITAEVIGTEHVKSAHELWAGNTPTSGDLLKQLTDPIQVKQYSEHMRVRDAPYPVDEKSMFVSAQLEIDHSKKIKEQTKIFADILSGTKIS